MKYIADESTVPLWAGHLVVIIDANEAPTGPHKLTGTVIASTNSAYLVGTVRDDWPAVSFKPYAVDVAGLV